MGCKGFDIAKTTLWKKKFGGCLISQLTIKLR